MTKKITKSKKIKKVGVEKKVFFLALNYLKYLPLTFYAFVLFSFISIVFAQEPKNENFFSEVLIESAGNKKTNAIDNAFVIRLIVIGWFIIAVAIELFKRFVKIELRPRYWFCLWAGILFVFTFLAAGPKNVIFIATFFYIPAVLCLLLYFMFDRILKILEKR